MEVDINRIREHVDQLTRVPRPAESVELEQARRYVTDCFEEFGWSVNPVRFGSIGVDGNHLQGINLVAHHREHQMGEGPRFCVGAHLDSCPNTVGADDNASAVAALLEIARILPDTWPDSAALGLELVAFDLEENGMLGGAYHAQCARRDSVDLRGMVSLEMLGYCDHAPGSQSLPRSLEGLYPDTGDFIAVIGNQNSHELIESFRDGMQLVDDLPVETLAVPENGNQFQATRLSDHSPFWDAGYSALMITDTSFLRNPHYHMSSDRIETLDMFFLHQVSEGCLQAVRQIVANGF